MTVLKMMMITKKVTRISSNTVLRSSSSSSLNELMKRSKLCTMYMNKTIIHHNILFDPNDHYNKLRHYIKNSNDEIILSALYLGSGKLEKQLVDDIKEVLELKKQLKVTFILDHSRAQRLSSNSNSISILQPLTKEYSKRCKLLLYQMPHLKYHYTKYLPIIAKEVLGVYHCKFCIFDDKALITGANLSDEYFTNRQDRYHYFSTTNNNDKNNDNVIVNFLKDFTRLLEPQCNQVQSDGIIINSNGNDDDFKYNLDKLMIKYNRNDENTYNSNSNNLNRMTILPLIQHSKIGINDESELLPMIINAFTNTSQKLSMFIASPYISFMNVLISSFVKFMNSNSNKLTIIAPSPSSHGFHNAKGIKSIVPKLHMQSQKSIVDIMKANIFTGDQRNDDNFKLIEFNREQWTFHSKGIWIFNNDNKDNGNSNGRNEQVSHMSYIGSSNFGQRSWQRDFEIGFIIISQDNDDCNNLLDECKYLLKYSNNSNRDGNNNNENSSYLIKLIMKIFRSFL